MVRIPSTPSVRSNSGCAPAGRRPGSPHHSHRRPWTARGRCVRIPRSRSIKAQEASTVPTASSARQTLAQRHTERRFSVIQSPRDSEVAMKRLALVLAFVGVAFTTLPSGQGGDPAYGKPKRLNKMIELLAAGQPVYDVGATGGGYEEGKKLAQTTNDLIQYEMEHGPFGPARPSQF